MIEERQYDRIHSTMEKYGNPSDDDNSEVQTSTEEESDVNKELSKSTEADDDLRTSTDDAPIDHDQTI